MIRLELPLVRREGHRANPLALPPLPQGGAAA